MEKKFIAFPTSLPTAQLKQVMETGVFLCLHKSRLATSSWCINMLLNTELHKNKILHNTVE